MLFTKDAAWRNKLGGMFGIASSLFSGFALVGIVYTIYLQSRDLRSGGKAQQRTQRLLIRQTTALNNHVDALVEQRRLSVLPYFVAFFADTEPEPGQWDMELVFRNIGNGIAINVVVREFEAHVRKLKPAAIAVELIGHRPILAPGEERATLLYLAPAVVKGQPRQTLKDRVSPTELHFQYFVFRLAFVDIEGRVCTQSIKMNQGLCYPDSVKILTDIRKKIDGLRL